MKKLTYKQTFMACCLGSTTMAITNNLPPLLYLTFQTDYALSLPQLAALISVNFGVQLTVDGLAAIFIDKIGYRKTVVVAHMFSTIGLICMGILPKMLSSPYAGLIASVVLCAIGSGLLEVIISPIVEAVPDEAKSANMSLLHSFYCWGYVLVVVASTVFFRLVGIQNWAYLCLIWALIPLFNSALFTQVPIWHLIQKGEKAMSFRNLIKNKFFFILLATMLCAGAAEQSMSQWASLFAESSLGVSKTLGDLLGPCFFAISMGTARLLLGSKKNRLSLETILVGSSILCIIAYLITVLVPIPIIALLGCGLSGFAVGSLWPSTLSLAAKLIPKGGTIIFALFALAGDVGCVAGPAVVAFVSEAYGKAVDMPGNATLKAGLAVAIVFPVLLLLMVTGIRAMSRRDTAAQNA